MFAMLFDLRHETVRMHDSVHRISGRQNSNHRCDRCQDVRR